MQGRIMRPDTCQHPMTRQNQLRKTLLRMGRLYMLRNGRVRDSSRESSVVAGLHEQTHPAELQDQELAGLQ